MTLSYFRFKEPFYVPISQLLN